MCKCDRCKAKRKKNKARVKATATKTRACEKALEQSRKLKRERAEASKAMEKLIKQNARRRIKDDGD